MHIPFYYVEPHYQYLCQVIKSIDSIPHDIDVFIYTNKLFWRKPKRNNVKLVVRQFWSRRFTRKRTQQEIQLSYPNVPFPFRYFLDPYYLTWRNRAYIEKTIGDYDIQMYMEDDILFLDRTLNYWMKYKQICIDNNYNLGFLRVENDARSGKWYYSDLKKVPGTTVTINGKRFVINDVNPYCGFWIYDKQELSRFINSKEWRFEIEGYRTREMSAIGWHGVRMSRYKGTIIPVTETSDGRWVPIDECHVHHLPNNYIGHRIFCSVEVPFEVHPEP